ncbi:MAG: ferritin-like domain-containing protein [Nitrospirae bacterium]|nr:ferritin-like domain-containing protein [Nitrospirota bacterium]
MAELSSALATALSEGLDRERRLSRAYRQHLLSASSPRVRQVLELGLAVKRRHEIELERLLSAAGGSPSAEGTGAVSLPGSREALTWYYEQERVLALRYREHLRLTDDPSVRQVVDHLATDQIEHLARLKSVYRGFSSA